MYADDLFYNSKDKKITEKEFKGRGIIRPELHKEEMCGNMVEKTGIKRKSRPWSFRKPNTETWEKNDLIKVECRKFISCCKTKITISVIFNNEVVYYIPNSCSYNSGISMSG